MDVIFKCKLCGQELEVDASGAGTEIECPSCRGKIVIPEAEAQPEAPPQEAAQPEAPSPGPRIVDPMASSAARKEEKHFSVPVHDKPAESLITKPLAPLEVAAKEAIKLRVKTIRHSDCVEVGKDHFDEVVTKFLDKIGETHLVSITPITYMHQDLASRHWIDDYGVLLVYRG
jgi:DNA-directed RNA polymerase subunit RPC12/RpoP